LIRVIANVADVGERDLSDGARERSRRMTLQLGATAPDFEAESTDGRIKFHDWIGESWAVLFSHPKDFTPICTTELGRMAKLKPEFDRRGVKIMALSVDDVKNHASWAQDIEETQGARPNYPMIADTDLKVSKLYDMLPRTTVVRRPTTRPCATCSSSGRTRRSSWCSCIR
jgi:alkyl hydroperoxide reductase subunit AhpC